MSVTALPPRVTTSDGSCCCGDVVTDCCTLPAELCVVFATNADATCPELRDLNQAVAHISWDDHARQWYGTFTPPDEDELWYFRLFCWCHNGVCYWRTGMGVLESTGTGTDAPPILDTGTGTEAEWSTGTGTFGEGDVWTSQTVMVPVPCCPFTTDAMHYDGDPAACYAGFSLTATVLCSCLVDTACCPNPVPLQLRITFYVDPSLNPGICADSSGGFIYTFTVTYRPDHLDWHNGSVDACDFLDAELFLSCIDGVWHWSVSHPGFVDSGVFVTDSCAPLHLSEDATDTAFGLNCKLLQVIVTE